MDAVFLTKLVISFVLGGTWVILATVLADKYGSKIGGLITGLPSTAIFSLVFLGLTNNPRFAVDATTIMPIGIAIENIYILILVLLVGRGLWFSVAGALVAWLFLSYPLVAMGFDNYSLSLVVYSASVVAVFYAIEKILNVKSVGKRQVVYTPKIILARGFLSGLMVALVVLVGRLGGPTLGGMVAVFPTLITSTMIITYLAHGTEFAKATMKSVVIGLSGLVVYSIMVRVTYLYVGIVPGTLLSLMVTMIWGNVVYQVLVKRLK